MIWQQSINLSEDNADEMEASDMELHSKIIPIRAVKKIKKLPRGCSAHSKIFDLQYFQVLLILSYQIGDDSPISVGTEA